MILWIDFENKIQRAKLGYIDFEYNRFNMTLRSTLNPVAVQPRHICGIEIWSDFNIMFDYENAIVKTDCFGEVEVFWLCQNDPELLDQWVRIIGEDDNDRNSILVQRLKDRRIKSIHVGEFGGVELDEQVVLYFKNATRREA